MTPLKKATLISAGVVAMLSIGAAIYAVIWFMQPSSQTIAIPQADLTAAKSPAVVAQAKADLATVRGGPTAGNPNYVTPFSGLRWRGEVAEVKVQGTWYELTAVNDHPAEKIFETARQTSADRWRAEVADHLGDLLEAMGDTSTGQVKLSLKKLDTQEAVDLDGVAMIAVNHSIGAVRAATAAFTGVRWNGDAAEVQVNGRWYGLTAINGQNADEIIAYAKTTFPDKWQKRFSEDLNTVMEGMHHPLGDAVDLQLRNLSSNEIVTLNQVPMTEDNRNSILDYNGSHAAAIAGAVGGASAALGTPRLPHDGAGSDKRSPFTGVRWTATVPQVQVNGRWYELLALDDQPTDAIVRFAQQTYGNAAQSGGPLMWKKRFAEDLVEVMGRMGHPLGDTASLQLKTLDTGETVALPSAAVTEENRAAIMGGQTTGAANEAGRTGSTAGRAGAGNGVAQIMADRSATPFTAVRWEDSTVLVKVSGAWYELLAVDDIPIEQIVGPAKIKYPDSTFPGWWRRQFIQWFRMLLTDVGHSPGDTVKLQLKKEDSGEVVTLNDVPMDANNQPLAMQYMRRNVFAAIRWDGNTLQVLVNGTWYEFLGINGHSYAELPAQKSTGQLEGSVVGLLASIGVSCGDEATLQLRKPGGGDVITLDHVAMTVENHAQIAGPRSAPMYSDIRLNGDTPQVLVDGTWYEWVALDDQPVAAIIDSAKQLSPGQWQQQLSPESIERLMGRSGHPLFGRPQNYASTIQLRALDGGQLFTVRRRRI